MISFFSSFFLHIIKAFNTNNIPVDTIKNRLMDTSIWGKTPSGIALKIKYNGIKHNNNIDGNIDIINFKNLFIFSPT